MLPCTGQYLAQARYYLIHVATRQCITGWGEIKNNDSLAGSSHTCHLGQCVLAVVHVPQPKSAHRGVE
jgi:hypothetical protein